MAVILFMNDAQEGNEINTVPVCGQLAVNYEDNDL